MKERVIPGINTKEMNEIISLNHGSGGKLSRYLIEKAFVGRFNIPEPLTDSAVFDVKGAGVAFTTDSYVVDPLFFPGGNIGKLAVCGTINDLAVSGAIPAYISAAFIIEEGFPVSDLVAIADSMAEEAKKAGVRIITGDTKVVEKGKCDKVFITTSGTGIIPEENKDMGTGSQVRPGDRILINGPVGNHSLAVLGARGDLSFTTPVLSDCACLNDLINSIVRDSRDIVFMRDLTRGGLATVLNELAGMVKYSIEAEESSVPVDEPVRGLCEMLGFNPLYLANEGKFIAVVRNGSENKVLGLMRSHPLGSNSAIIGKITSDSRGLVFLNTSAGGRRNLEMLSGSQLPRIC